MIWGYIFILTNKKCSVFETMIWTPQLFFYFTFLVKLDNSLTRSRN